MPGLQSSRSVVLLVLAVVLGGVGAASFAVSAGKSSEVRLCVKKADGSVRVVKSGGCQAGEKLSVVNKQGVQGVPGPQGLPGASGPSGPTGPTGPTGAAGPSGPTGGAGPTGVAGPSGPSGPSGPAGATGPTGPAGPTGPRGSTGPQGPIGPQGPQGEPAPEPVVLPAYAGTFVMEFSGTVQRVRRLYGCNQPDFDAPPQPCRVELTGVPRPATLAWIQQSLALSADPLDVSFREYDFNFKETAELQLGEATITRVALTDLDASANTAASVVIDLEGGTLKRMTGDATTVSLGTAPTQMLSSNFKVTVQGSPFQMTTKVTDLSVPISTGPGADLHPDGTLGLVSATTNGGYADLAGWSDDASQGGTRTLELELLSANLASTLLTFELTEAAPLGYPEPFGVGDVGNIGRVSVDVLGRRVDVS